MSARGGDGRRDGLLRRLRVVVAGEPLDDLARRVVALGIAGGAPVMLVVLALRGDTDPLVRLGYPPVVVMLLGYAWVLVHRPARAVLVSRVVLGTFEVLWLASVVVRLRTADDVVQGWAALFPLSFMGLVVFVVVGYLFQSTTAALLHGVILVAATLATTLVALAGVEGGRAYVVDASRFCMYLAVVVFMLYVLSGAKERLARAEASAARASARALELHDLAYLDELTGVGNRRRVVEELAFRAGQVTADEPVAVLYFDLDRFKAVNDEHGHAVGDEVLRAVAAAAGTVVRREDVVGRLGGEEFVVVAPGTDRDRAVQLAERLRQTLPHEVSVATGVRATASFGVVMVEPGESPESVLTRVDVLMYRAKSGGRDRVEVAG
ncbi:GGDEF domain-containing protein [Cellulomonas carbonis]|uniref:Diguanylate cyclase n=1 Tax=Cellulomonas carbonis T26 TaxID=947969 RepID=A0A0A0BSB7_9CELL|nr:GGDEF domain-containing protein [Cellulomonas carbonis]KGM11333.1 diguanylate cyclase [Cellulomonas carbonis T26]GGB97726.1 hypothetical protein GCM10010972_08140 [Cellulomonas carbonis]